MDETSSFPVGNKRIDSIEKCYTVLWIVKLSYLAQTVPVFSAVLSPVTSWSLQVGNKNGRHEAE